MSGIRAVVFDYGGVICVDPFVGLVELERQMDLPTGALCAEFRGGSLFREAELGRMPLAAFFEAWRTDVASRHGVDLDLATTQAAMSRGGDINPATLDLVERLRPEYRLAILTNNVRESRTRRERVLPPGWFEVVVDSCEVGLRKPDVEIYEVVLERLGLAGDEVAYIDDFEENLAPAASLGMHTVLFTSPEACERELAALGVTATPRRR